jgi:hypothetical protein
MTYRIARKSLAALLLCGAVLAGCGGDADAPPPVGGAPGPGPDTTPPTVSIASDVSVPKATGPVTFTFVFSEDVGVSFEQADILVSGGTGGPFTRVDGRQATLVVTPTPGVAGTMTVSVGPGSFTDIAGNANTDSASASQDFMATQTINFASPGDQTIGQPTPALNATASSGLPVTINSTTPGVCTVSGTALTLVAAGSCSLVATQTGDANFAPAPAVTQTFSVAGSGGGGGVSDVVFSSGWPAATARSREVSSAVSAAATWTASTARAARPGAVAVATPCRRYLQRTRSSSTTTRRRRRPPTCTWACTCSPRVSPAV